MAHVVRVVDEPAAAVTGGFFAWDAAAIED
jgi:hypothetical protein